jgi:hypothetical protein
MMTPGAKKGEKAKRGKDERGKRIDMTNYDRGGRTGALAICGKLNKPSLQRKRESRMLLILDSGLRRNDGLSVRIYVVRNC